MPCQCCGASMTAWNWNHHQFATQMATLGPSWDRLNLTTASGHGQWVCQVCAAGVKKWANNLFPIGYKPDIHVTEPLAPTLALYFQSVVSWKSPQLTTDFQSNIPDHWLLCVSGSTPGQRNQHLLMHLNPEDVQLSVDVCWQRPCRGQCNNALINWISKMQLTIVSSIFWVKFVAMTCGMEKLHAVPITMDGHEVEV